jgi:hypothetical protein
MRQDLCGRGWIDEEAPTPTATPLSPSYINVLFAPTPPRHWQDRRWKVSDSTRTVWGLSASAPDGFRPAPANLDARKFPEASPLGWLRLGKGVLARHKSNQPCRAATVATLSSRLFEEVTLYPAHHSPSASACVTALPYRSFRRSLPHLVSLHALYH